MQTDNCKYCNERAMNVVREVLTEHWVTEIRCNHEDKTDTAFCACSEYPGEPANSVSGAVNNWIDHVVKEIERVLEAQS